MVQPTSGPFYTESYNDAHGTGSFWEQKWKYKQAKPYSLPLPYQHTISRNVKTVPVGTFVGDLDNAHAGHSPTWSWASPRDKGDVFVDAAMLRARERFLKKLGESSQLSTTFGEWRQSLGMMTNRIKSLTKALDYTKRSVMASRAGDHKLGLANLGKALKTLGTGGDPDILKKKYGHSKTLANQWLEIHFGWVPLIEDLYDAMDTLSAPLPYGKVYASCKSGYKETPSSGYPGQWAMTSLITGKIRCRVGGHVEVTNPNLYLLNRLGLANPASLAWELTPWSFVVDWFTTVGAFIGQFTDQLGFRVVDGWHSLKVEESCDFSYTIIGNPQIPYLRMKTEAVHFRRYLGLPDVNLGFRPLKGPSVVRAATAMSLLIQKLPNK